MGIKIFLGEPPAHIKQWIIDHYGPTPPPPPVTSKITITYENGDTLEVDGPLTGSNIGPTADIISITVPDGAEISDEQNLFISCVKLSEITFGDNTMVPDDIETKVQNWSLGLDVEGNTHLVVLYYGNGVVVINDADDSSGERGFKVDWNKFVGWLENFDSSVLPEPGKSIIVPYKVDPDPNARPVDTEWMILGYNKTIPRYVKYKDEAGNRVYMDTMKDGLLRSSSDFNGATVYSTKDGTGNPIGNVSSPTGTFEYGNNNKYVVPTKITVNSVEYDFCGYNVTLQSKYGLAAKYNDIMYVFPQFRSYEKSNEYRNDWSTSELRDWLNGTGDISKQTWSDTNFGNPVKGQIAVLPTRLPDVNFINNIIPAVNRMWVNESWISGKTYDINGCEHVTDKFFILGVGEVNCYGDNTSQYFPDGGALIDGTVHPAICGYDTSRFVDVFNKTDVCVREKTRQRRYMKEDGTRGRPCRWWLRSAYSDYSYNVGFVDDYGDVNRHDVDDGYCGVFPVCLIG